MKRKFAVIIAALVAALATTLSVSAFADEIVEETELKIAAVDGQTYPYDITVDNRWGMMGVLVKFDSANTFGMYGAAEVPDFEYVDAYGNVIENSDCINVGTTYFIFRFKADAGATKIGDTLTIKQGFALKAHETIKEDLKFIVVKTDDGSQLAPYTEELEGKGLEITTSSDYSVVSAGMVFDMTSSVGSGYGTVYYTTTDETVATVTASGTVTAVAPGTCKIIAHLKSETKEYELTVTEAKEIIGLEIVNNYKSYVEQGSETFALPAYKAHLKFEGDTYGPDFDLTAENTTFNSAVPAELGTYPVTLTVTYQGNEYEVTMNIEVYEVGDIDIKEVAIVDWFAYALFIQYPNSTENNANITDSTVIPGVFDHISYVKADGTEIEINGGYMLGGGNIAIFPYSGLNEDNYNEYYKDGDILTLEKGMNIYRWSGETYKTDTDDKAIKAGTGEYVVEGRLAETVQYRYDGNVWGLYVEYTDVEAKAESITLTVGESADTGVTRVPANATTGTFTYASSDETVATVSARGVIKAVGAGTCAITVTIDGGTAGEKSATVNVTVTDTETAIELTPSSVEITVGGEIDLSGVTATYVFASGKKEGSADLAQATVAGFDPDKTGEQTVVVSVVKDGKTLSGRLTVKVNAKASGKGGCKGIVGGASILSLLAVGAMFIIRGKRK